ncbi:alpha/beta fold hydrolase [Glaciecola sp. SC05]|uniref:alpha/beta fold hydrolase n=1 Tax=Glaciecola sp. SC05 TaxID=1987355 RepID=UPI0035279F5A
MIKTNIAELSTTSVQYLSVFKQSEDQASQPLLIMLHGFPENSWSWQAYLESLSGDFEVIAPDLPGYNGSSGYPSDKDYTIAHLVETMAEFVKHVSGGRPVHLVAHDWGGVIAWPLVAFYRDLFAKLSILNAAHPTGFTREMANNPRQQANSDYITDLISEDAFSITSADEHKMLKRLYGGFYKRLTTEQQSAYVNQWSNPHTMKQAFAYYKNMPQLVTQRLRANSDVKLPNIEIKVPTQVLWGMKDTAFVPEVLNGMEQWIEELSLVKFDDADHWLHHQKIPEVIAHIRKFHLA